MGIFAFYAILEKSPSENEATILFYHFGIHSNKLVPINKLGINGPKSNTKIITASLRNQNIPNPILLTD